MRTGHHRHDRAGQERLIQDSGLGGGRPDPPTTHAVNDLQPPRLKPTLKSRHEPIPTPLRWASASKLVMSTEKADPDTAYEVQSEQLGQRRLQTLVGQRLEGLEIGGPRMQTWAEGLTTGRIRYRSHHLRPAGRSVHGQTSMLGDNRGHLRSSIRSNTLTTSLEAPRA